MQITTKKLIYVTLGLIVLIVFTLIYMKHVKNEFKLSQIKLEINKEKQDQNFGVRGNSFISVAGKINVLIQLEGGLSQLDIISILGEPDMRGEDGFSYNIVGKDRKRITYEGKGAWIDNFHWE